MKMAVDSVGRTLYIGNLHKDVTEDILYELFLQAGPIERVNIPITSNKSFVYGFVTYLHECTVDYAIQLYKGTSLYNKELVVKRKGEKNNGDQQGSEPDRGYEENSNDFEFNHCSTPYSANVKHQISTNDFNNQGKLNFHNSKLMQNSLKGHWSDHNKPYNRDTRRHHSSRSHESRNWKRNYDYQKSQHYRNRRHSHANS